MTDDHLSGQKLSDQSESSAWDDRQSFEIHITVAASPKAMAFLGTLVGITVGIVF